MQHRARTIGLLISGMTLSTSPVFATDYSGVSTEDLAKQWGSMRGASEQERNQLPR